MTYEIKQFAPVGGSTSVREEHFKTAMTVFAQWVASEPEWACVVYARQRIDCVEREDDTLLYPLVVYTPARRV